MDISYVQSLIRKQGLDLRFGAIALSVALPMIARVFWRIGVRHYSGASA